MSYDANHDVSLLVSGIQRFGTKQSDGTFKTTFGSIFKDEVLEQQLESLVGTMKAARKAGLLTFKGEMLLYPSNAGVEVTLVKQ